MKPCRSFLTILGVAVIMTAVSLSALAQETGEAVVNNNGTIEVGGRTLHLYGIQIPERLLTCEPLPGATSCQSQVANALSFAIEGEVTCEERGQTVDGNPTAICRAARPYSETGIDLGGYLVRQGFAEALPEAPADYEALESAARERKIGIWGMRRAGE